MFATNVKKNSEKVQKLSSMSPRGEWKHACTTHLTIIWLFNDIMILWCYLFIACFEWKIGVFQQTVVMVYYILKQTPGMFKIVHFWVHTLAYRVFTEAAIGGVLQEKVFWESFPNSQENTCARVSFLIKLQATFIKKDTLAQVFSGEFCKIF